MKKTILILTLVAGSLIFANAGNDPVKVVKESGPAVSKALVYSESNKAIIYEDSLQLEDFSHIYFKSLPPFIDNSFPVSIVLTKGNYTISKSPDLDIPLTHRVYIEDTWSEQTYNLNSSESYSFKVKSTDPERFVLHIERPVMR